MDLKKKKSRKCGADVILKITSAHVPDYFKTCYVVCLWVALQA
jgi:hypothetical protein